MTQASPSTRTSPSFRLDGRRALVTGASRGIGRGIALGFAAMGADVAVTARSKDALASVAEAATGHGARATAIPADMLDPDAPAQVVDQCVDAIGGIDILVHNAGRMLIDSGGAATLAPLASVDDTQWSEVVDINLTAAYRLCREGYEHLRTSPGGAVILVSSVAGLAAPAHADAYAASKAAQVSLARTLAVAWASEGIRVNALCPGWVRTQLTTPFHSNAAISQPVIEKVPQGRWAEVAEIVGPAVFLASEEARFVTGHALVVDGGLTANPILPALG